MTVDKVDRNASHLSYVVLSVSTVTAILIVLFLLYKSKIYITFMDFFIYYQAGERLINGGNIYIQSYPESFSSGFADNIRIFSIRSGNRWLYLPLSGLFFIPFSLLKSSVAVFIWTVVSIVALIIGCWTLLSEYSDWSIKQYSIVFIFIICYYPLILTLERGQITTLLTAILCFSATKINDESKIVYDILFVIPAIIKPFYMPYGSPLLADRKRLLRSILTGTGVFAVSLLIFGLQTHLEYINWLLWGKTWGTLSRSPVLWSAYIFRPMYAILPFQLLIKSLIIILVLALDYLIIGGYLTTKGDKSKIVLFIIGVSVIPLVAPMSNVFTLVTLIPAILLLFAIRINEGRSITSVVLAVALIQLQILYVSLPDIFSQAELIFNFFPPSLIGLGQPAIWGIVSLLYSSVSLLQSNF